MKKPPRVVVVGAGIAGLTTAYRLQTMARRSNCAINITVLESDDRAGGVIETSHTNELIMERGPDSLVTEKPWAVELCREIGLGDRLISTQPNNARSFIVRGNRLQRIPEGLHLMAPSRLWPFAFSGLVSIGGKLRMAADLVIPRRSDHGDESLGSFVRRRLGREALSRIAQPMIGGIYTADPERLSLQATMPQFLEMEHNHGSVIRGMIAARKERGARIGSARGPRYDLFVTLDGGMALLPERLIEVLGQGVVRLGTQVESVTHDGNTWTVRTQAGTAAADAICMATPAPAAASILREAAPEISAELDEIECASSATINLSYRLADIGRKLDGFGFVVPAEEHRCIIACTFSSVKYAGRAPNGIALLRAFVGGALFPEYFDEPDDAIIDSVHASLAELLKIKTRPVDVLLSRYPRSMPQYHIGHIDRINRIDDALASRPGLALAGNAYRGTGIPDCVRSGNRAAEQITRYLFDCS